MLEIENLHVSIHKRPILKDFRLKVRKGEIHAIMGPNGAGKSTLSKVLAGHPEYEILQGSISFKGKNLLELEPEERAQSGLFVSFQYPLEIPGISNFEFLYAAYLAKQKAVEKMAPTKEEFRLYVEKIINHMQISSEFLDRDINSGFSGGEKKRNELLQMAVLKPDLAVLDETDSGLDIDALKTVAAGVKREMREDNALVLITHYQRLLDYIKPHFVHVLLKGKIVLSGDSSLAQELEKRGYDWILEKEEARV